MATNYLMLFNVFKNIVMIFCGTNLQNQLKAIDRELRSARAECKQCEERIEELRNM